MYRRIRRVLGISSPRLVYRSTLILVVALAGLALCGLIFLDLRGWELRAVHKDLETLADQRTALLRSKLQSTLEVLHGVGSFAASRRELTRREFREFVQDALERQSEIQALEFAPWISSAGREDLEKKIRQEGYPAFTITRKTLSGALTAAGPQADYVPICYVEPMEGNSPAFGLDLLSNEARRAALLQARDLGRLIATCPVMLTQDPHQWMGILVFRPIYDGSDDTLLERRAHLRGFALAVFRLRRLLEPPLEELAATGVYCRVADRDAPDRDLLEVARPADLDSSLPPVHREVAVAGRTWQLSYVPTRGFISSRLGWQAYMALGGGILLTLIFGGWQISILRNTLEIERTVKSRTRELSGQILERQRVEEALRQAEARYRGIFEHCIEGIFQTAPEGRYLTANPTLARIYGDDSPESLIERLSDIEHQLYVNSERRQEFVDQVLREGFVTDFESQIYRRDRKVIWIRENARAVRNSAGELLYFEGMVVDITRRKIAEESLHRIYEELEQRVDLRTRELAESNAALQREIQERRSAEDRAESANRAKSAFLANMSHEIRTPMNAILGYAQILRRNAALDRRQREALETILQSGRHLLTLLNDILDLSKIEAGHMKLDCRYFDLMDMARGLEAMFQPRCMEKRIAFRLQTQGLEDSWPVFCDEARLKQILINLVGNAVKFTDLGQVTLEMTRHGERSITFRVRDTGPGIAPDQAQEIFKPFRQASSGLRRGGTGLGLSIARQCVVMLGGVLQMSSMLGEGSTFEFTLELQRLPGAVPSTALRGVCEPLGISFDALVVDDLPENLQVLTEMLEYLGGTVRQAISGPEALRQLESHIPDLIFVDIVMPGMNGIELAARIRERLSRRPLPLVVLSASVMTHEQELYREVGFDRVVPKPVEMEVLAQVLRDLLGVSPQRSLPPTLPADATGSIPGKLLQRLERAARDCRVTDLKRAIGELEELGHRQLAGRLRSFLQQYRMDEIIARLRIDSDPGSKA